MNYSVNGVFTMIEILNGIKETVNYLGNSTIKLYNNTINENYPLHWHTSLEIIMPTENIYTAYCNNIKYTLQEGDILIISPGVLHQLEAPLKGKRYIIQADLSPLNSMREFESLAAILSPSVYISPSNSPKLYEQLRDVLYKIVEEYESEVLYRETVIYSLLISLFALIGRNQTADRYDADDNSSRQQTYSKIFLSVCNYINNHFNENISLEQVADLAGFSKYHFSRIFKQYADISFYQYVNKKRIMNAASLLLEPDLSITEVALQCGFTSISAFIRMFKIHNGCTPSEYKEMHIKDTC
jgi:AraC-like DNA-binding protein